MRARIFYGLQIRRYAGQKYSTHHDNPGKNAWRSFTAVVENFLRNFKALNYHDLSKELLNCYEQ